MRSLLLAILLVWSGVSGAAIIEGRIVRGDNPVPGMVVKAYGSLDLAGVPLAIAEPSDAEGLYRLELPPGSYALAGRDPERGLFALCGRNPVNLVGETSPVWVGLQAVPVEAATVARYDDDYSAALEGVVLNAGKPVTDAYVYLYLDVAEDLKGQGYRLSLPTGPDGYFRFDGLPESDYFLVARKRQGGQRVGPVREGDLFGVYPDNPAPAKAGEVRQVRLHMAAKLKDAANSETFGRATGPVLRGVVVDAAGTPQAGLHVFAYTDRVIGHQRPAAISTPTGADGRFTVNLPQAGVYYVGAREEYGDSPAPGELFGMYDLSADHGLTIESGEQHDDLRIEVEPIEIY